MPNQYTVGEDVPWRNEAELAKAYYGDRSVEEISDDWGCSPGTIHRWVDKHGLERKESYGGEWTDREKMFDLYWGDRLTTKEMAERLGCTQPTISDWLSKHNIPTRFTANEYGKISTTQGGYEYFAVDCEIVWIHRLLAISEYGFEEVVGKQVHHKNEIPFDNRPKNIEPLSEDEHIERHRTELIKERHRN